VFFHHNSIRQYTGALLSLFNKIEIEKTLSNGDLEYQRVPIQLSNQERSVILNQLSANQIINGNTQVIPRMILVFNGIEVNRSREKNKFIKIKFNNKFYQFNSIPYDFDFDVICHCRGLNEASMIIEQVNSFFNPSFTFRIKEIPLCEDYTSIVTDLTGTSIEREEESEQDLTLGIVTITFNLKVRGNIYPIVKNHELIKQIQLYLHSIENREFLEYGKLTTEQYIERVKSYGYDVETDETFYNQFFCEIKDIIYKNGKLTCHYNAPCEKLVKFYFEWYVNDEQVYQHKRVINKNIYYGDKVKVRMFSDFSETDYFEKEFTIQNTYYGISVDYLTFSKSNFLEVNYTDMKNKSNSFIGYTYEWTINGETHQSKNRIIKLNLVNGEKITLPDELDIKVKVISTSDELGYRTGIGHFIVNTKSGETTFYPLDDSSDNQDTDNSDNTDSSDKYDTIDLTCKSEILE